MLPVILRQWVYFCHWRPVQQSRVTVMDRSISTLRRDSRGKRWQTIEAELRNWYLIFSKSLTLSDAQRTRFFPTLNFLISLNFSISTLLQSSTKTPWKKHRPTPYPLTTLFLMGPTLSMWLVLLPPPPDITLRTEISKISEFFNFWLPKIALCGLRWFKLNVSKCQV